MSVTTVSSFTALNTAIDLHAGVSLVIEGGTLHGGTDYAGLFVYQGDVTLENLTLKNFKAQGGAGAGGGGGGGLGAGGDIFVQQAASSSSRAAHLAPALSAVVRARAAKHKPRAPPLARPFFCKARKRKHLPLPVAPPSPSPAASMMKMAQNPVTALTRPGWSSTVPAPSISPAPAATLPAAPRWKRVHSSSPRARLAPITSLSPATLPKRWNLLTRPKPWAAEPRNPWAAASAILHNWIPSNCWALPRPAIPRATTRSPW